MTSEASQTEYKIYLDSVKKDKILNDANTYEKYVIFQNETLHAKVNELLDKVKELESSVEELEDDNGRMEKSKGYTRNLLKNFSELDKLNIEWRGESKKHYKEIQKIHNSVFDFTYQCVVLFNVVLTIHLAISFYVGNSIPYVIFRTGIYGFFLYLSIKFYLVTIDQIKFNLIEQTDKVNPIKENIKKINDCYDFINEYIDNV